MLAIVIIIIKELTSLQDLLINFENRLLTVQVIIITIITTTTTIIRGTS
jgi:hypothetical protein